MIIKTEDKVTVHRYHHWFDTSQLKSDLKGKSIKGGISITSSQMITFSLNMLSTIILARILLPADFGLIAMVTAFTGFANMLKDFGLSLAVIQRNKITHDQVSTVFWLNVFICGGIAVIFALLAPLIVILYGEPRLFAVMLAYAAGIIISGFSLQHTALLNRQMKFTKVAMGNILAALLSILLGISAALSGLSYWSIVILNVSQIAFSTIFMWLFCSWRPSRPVRKSGIRNFIYFGAGITGFNFINYFARNMDNVLVGRFLGAATLGFYSKAYQLLMLPLTQLRDPLTTVCIPALSSLKDDFIKYRNYYRKYLFLLAFFSMPLVTYLAIFSDEIVTTVLGDQWARTSYIFKLLAISAFLQPVAGTRGLILISTGQSRRYFIWGIINAIFVVSTFCIGIQWGIEGLTIGYAFINYLLLVPSLFYCFKNTPVTVPLFFKELMPPFIHTMLLAFILFFIKITLVNTIPDLILLIITAIIGASLYYGSWLIYPAGKNRIKGVNEVILHFKEKIKRKQ